MPIYNIKLIKKIEVAEGTMAFVFEKPDGFIFKAGQFGDFTLLNPKQSDDEGNTRGFSIASSPNAKELMFTTRMRDTAFKRTIKELPLGTEIKFDAPYGSFTLHKNTSIPAVYLTGGIGITPVRSIVLQAANDKLLHDIYLFYSNNRPEDAAFLNELIALEKENIHYKFIGTMTNMEKSNQQWNGEHGFINKEMIIKYIKDITAPIYYISGPAKMVTAMRKMLVDASVNEDNIRTEEFSGY